MSSMMPRISNGHSGSRPQLRATTDIEAVVAAIEDDQCSVQVLADHCRFVGIAAPQRDAVTAARYRTRSTRSDPARMPATPQPASPSPRIRDLIVAAGDIDTMDSQMIDRRGRHLLIIAALALLGLGLDDLGVAPWDYRH